MNLLERMFSKSKEQRPSAEEISWMLSNHECSIIDQTKKNTNKGLENPTDSEDGSSTKSYNVWGSEFPLFGKLPTDPTY